MYRFMVKVVTLWRSTWINRSHFWPKMSLNSILCRNNPGCRHSSLQGLAQHCNSINLGDDPSTTAFTAQMPLPPAPGFAPASSLPRSADEPQMQPPTTVPTAAPSNRNTSNRNASNAHLPVPSAPPITLDADGVQIPSSTAASVGKDGKPAPKQGTNVNGVEGGAAGAAAAEKTNKPVNVPSGSKRSIVVNARQVSFRCGI